MSTTGGGPIDIEHQAHRLQHALGEATIEDEAIVNRMHIRGGLFRAPRELEQRWPIAQLTAIRRYRDPYGLHMTLFSKGREIGDGVQHCSSEEELDAFVTAVVAINASIEVNRALDETTLQRDAVAAASAAPLIDIVRYRDARHYERDARVRIAHGWRAHGQSQDATRAAIGGKIGTAAVTGAVSMSPAVGAASMLIPQRKGGAITITWVKEPGQPAPVVVPSVAIGAGDLSSQLERLSNLHQQGILTDEEFSAAKAKILG